MCSELVKPVFVMRNTTVCPEVLAAGTVRLVRTDYNKIVTDVLSLFDDKTHYEDMLEAYTASARCVKE